MATNNLGQQVNAQGMTVAQMVAAGQASTAAALARDTSTSNVTAPEPLTSESLTEGLISPMSLGDIRASDKFRAGEAVIREGADAGFDPSILRAKTEGRGQVSTAEGITGQQAGFNVSSAELSFIASTQDKVAGAIKDIQVQKQAYIDQGLMDLATQLGDQEFKLIEASNNLVLQKANLALNVRGQQTSEAQFAQTFGLSERQFAESQDQFASNLANQIATLTGSFADGSPTFQAVQADIANAFDRASLTGELADGTPTFQALQADIQNILAERGMVIQEEQLKEMIRSNMVQEGLSRARLSAAQEEAEEGGALDFTGLTYNEAKNKAAEYMAGIGNQLDQTTWDQVMQTLDLSYFEENNLDKETLKLEMETLTGTKRTDQDAAAGLFGGDVPVVETETAPDQSYSDWWNNLTTEQKAAEEEKARLAVTTSSGSSGFSGIKDFIKKQFENGEDERARLRAIRGY